MYCPGSAQYLLGAATVTPNRSGRASTLAWSGVFIGSISRRNGCARASTPNHCVIMTIRDHILIIVETYRMCLARTGQAGYRRYMKNKLMTNRYETLPEPQFGARFVTAFVYVVAAGMVLMYVCGIGGCAAPEQFRSTRPGQVEAAQFVLDYYGGTFIASDLPTITWREPFELNCDYDAQGNPTGWTESRADGLCVFGEFWPESLIDGPAQIVLAWPAGMTKMSQTGMAHEIGHWYKLQTGHADPDHYTEMFCAPDQVGPCDGWGGRSMAARDAMVASGL